MICSECNSLIVAVLIMYDVLDLHGIKSRNIEDLSGGELQRFAIAIVCIQRADVWVFFTAFTASYISEPIIWMLLKSWVYSTRWFEYTQHKKTISWNPKCAQLDLSVLKIWVVNFAIQISTHLRKLADEVSLLLSLNNILRRKWQIKQRKHRSKSTKTWSSRSNSGCRKHRIRSCLKW